MAFFKKLFKKAGEKRHTRLVEAKLAQQYDLVSPWILEGDSLVLQEENLLLCRFEETGRE